MKLDVLHALNAERAARRAAVLVTDVASGEQRLVKAADVARDPLKDVIEKRIRSGKSGMEETPGGKVFLTVHVPPAQLVITGAAVGGLVVLAVRPGPARASTCSRHRSLLRPCPLQPSCGARR